MKAQIGRRNLNERTKLEKVIPLDTPFLLFVDPSSVCNFQCDFCPCGGAHKDLWNPSKKTNIMSYECFRKVVDDATRFPRKIKTLRLYKEGEPLINPRLPDMIRYAKGSGAFERVDLTSNASLLTHDMALALVDSGLDRINLSIEAMTSEEYWKVSKFKVDITDLLKKLTFFYNHRGQCHIFLKISDYGLNGRPEKDFYEMFGDCCDEISVEHVSDVWPGFQVDQNEKIRNDVNVYGDALSKRTDQKVCPYLFYSMCVNSDGSVSCCLMDWNHIQIVGDVYQESLQDIWNGENMRQMRIDHLKLNKDTYAICKHCGQLKTAALDNIDPYRLDILQKIKNSSSM